MISAPTPRIKNFRLLVIAGILVLAGCEAEHPQPSPQVVRPTVHTHVVKPRVTNDGTVMVLRDQYIQHIGTPGVFVLAENGKARFRMVKAGKVEGKWIVITSGLRGDEAVLKGSLESVLDGSPVTVNED